MHFRLSLIALHLSLYPGGVEPLVLTLQRDHELRVTMNSETVEEPSHDVRLRCVVDTTFDPSPRISEAFEHLANDRLPPGHLPREQWSKDHHIDEDGTVREYVVPLYLLPDHFKTFREALYAELRGAADAALGVLRWRSSTLGSRDPFAGATFEWTLDDLEWRPFPTMTYAEFADVKRLGVSDAAAAQMQALLDADQLEPLAHTLYREAWSQRRTNPRSALLIGLTALEIGVKHYVAACVPTAEWLVVNAPTPPIADMLDDYLPTLDPPGGKRFEKPDNQTIKDVRKAVRERNALAHRGADPPSDRLVRRLRLVRGILWRLDEALGHEWAANYRSGGEGPVGYSDV